MNENKSVTVPLRKAIEARGHVCMKYHGTVYSVKGHSDLYGFLGGPGKAFFIECKAPGKKPSPDQLAFLERMLRHGAEAGWVDSVGSGLALIRMWEDRQPAVYKVPLDVGSTSANLNSSSGTGCCGFLPQQAISPEDAGCKR